MRNGTMRGIVAGYLVKERSANGNYAETKNTTTNVSTPTRPSRTRVALASQDKNVLIHTTQNPTKRGIIMPPSEKQQNNHPRPLLNPTTKVQNKTPLTPRIAGSTPSTTSTRRPPRSETNGTPSIAHRDEQSAPGLLGSNITPRSGPRRSRVESPNATPIRTPTPHVPAPRIADPPRGLGIGGNHNEETKRPTVSFAPASDFTSQSKSQQNVDSKFFFASDAKPSTPSLPARPNLQTKGSSFFYANGDSVPPVIKSSSSAVGSVVGSVIGSVTGEERRSPMFFHANGAPDIPHSTNSNISNARIASPRLTANLSNPPPHRPASPMKSPSVISTRTAPVLSSPLLSRPNSTVARGQSSHSVVASRRVSVEVRPPHGRSASAGSFEFSPPGRKVTRSPAESMPVTPSPVTPSNFSSVVTLSTPEERQERDEARDNTEHELGSPIRAGGTLEQMNELAAEARRDRKVLDLEITNSSLEAINRTLEKQLRKQNAELRRYRRLSRSGRLSLATSTRNSGGDFSIMAGVTDGDLTDMSEDDEEEEDDDREGNSSEEDSMDDGSLSPGAIAESDARHRQKDEKRLRQDLSKHQQLLADSQSMNSSIKRCLAWTEELINEGKKALEYKVKPSDVKIGGRILISDEIEEEAEGLSEIGMRLVREARMKRNAVDISPSAESFATGASSDWIDRGADRDSGIELPRDYRADNSGLGLGLPMGDYTNLLMEHPAPP